MLDASFNFSELDDDCRSMCMSFLQYDLRKSLLKCIMTLIELPRDPYNDQNSDGPHNISPSR